MSGINLSRVQSDRRFAWNDIEALPIYAAILLGLTCVILAMMDGVPTIHATLLKVVGIVGSLALRHAWLKLDEEDGSSF